MWSFEEFKESFASAQEYMHRQREKEALEALQSAINDYQRNFGDWR